MKRALLMVLVIGLMTSTAWASWDHPIKWDQIEPWSYNGVGSVINTPADGGLIFTSADDWLCNETGWITDIHFHGFYPDYVEQFKVTFWEDVPAGAEDESHPGAILQEVTVGPEVGGVGWTFGDFYEFGINLPQDEWFWQEEGNIYWVSVQAIMAEDGYVDYFYWGTLEPDYGDLDDAVFWDEDLQVWAHWGWFWEIDPDTQELVLGLDQYYGVAPEVVPEPVEGGYYGSADLTFYLTGIPEPASLSLLALGALVLIRRR
jgi:hypothetical protein